MDRKPSAHLQYPALRISRSATACEAFKAASTVLQRLRKRGDRQLESPLRPVARTDAAP